MGEDAHVPLEVNEPQKGPEQATATREAGRMCRKCPWNIATRRPNALVRRLVQIPLEDAMGTPLCSYVLPR